MSDPVYLDHAATTPLRPEARDAMLAALDGRWGNPSSIHRWGRDARAALDDARARFAAVIGASPAEIVFTRGGTEADNMALWGRARLAPSAPLACSAVEHSAVLNAVRAAGEAGHPVHLLPVDGNGLVDLDALRALLAGEEKPAVVSVMWANNEVGAMQPVREIAALCRASGVVFHSDAVQALGKVPVRADEVAADLLAFSAHKLGGPRGVGALYVRRGTAIQPMLHGGGQERGMRPGTEDVAGAIALAVAAELAAAERQTLMPRLAALRDRLEAELFARVPGLVLNAAGAPRLPTISNVSVPGADAEMLLIGMDMEGIAVSSGSACSSGAVTPSHVLTAMGVAPQAAGPSVRFSLGRGTTDADIDRVIHVFPAVAERVRL
ncbi:MAG TPA: cysteine desulfurase family protein [Longimicrobium sp.]|jgi:cysteine desulfurase|uniref:cysteine desulfurase family protein n=1 Tax=Longimicrobium sp. TaxID=2029185 RepID=UPI002EDB3519